MHKPLMVQVSLAIFNVLLTLELAGDFHYRLREDKTVYTTHTTEGTESEVRDAMCAAWYLVLG